jgi:hypothetical protein
MRRRGYLLAGIPTKDLYSLISKCDDAQRRGFPWSAIFWKEIRHERSTSLQNQPQAWPCLAVLLQEAPKEFYQ